MGEVEHVPEGHVDQVNCVAFSPDGMQIVSGVDDKSVWIWSVATGKSKHTLNC